MTKLRIPLDKWHEDMERLAGAWSGEETTFQHEGQTYTEEQAILAGETAELIEELDKNLDFIGY